MNELEDSDSAYLQHHAKNPIHWKKWSKKTINESLKKNQLIVLSIGYSACHWCHVMEKEAFSNELIASFMNEHFTCVKVDREEHPEIDNIYMDFILDTRGNGGWPLNCILLPDTKPIFAGTYYNSNDWLSLISKFKTIYQETPDKLIEFSKNYMSHISKEKTTRHGQSLEIKNLFQDWKNFLDLKNGGIKSNQKFPMPNFLIFLIRNQNSENWAKFLEKTLKKITQKGLYDHLEGGFFRYCVDSEWNIPHFEKMLYDSAQLIGVLSQYDAGNNGNRHREMVQKTIDFWLSIRNNSALFPASLDADNIEGEGGYYWFKKEDVRVLLSNKEQKVLENKFGMTTETLIDDKWHIHDDHSKTVKNKDDLLKKLNTLRAKNSFPDIDKKAICSWNCMMVVGLIDAGIGYKNSHWLQLAEQTLNSILNHFIIQNKCQRLVYTNDKIEGTLEDYSWLIAATLKMSSIINSSFWLEQSLLWGGVSIENFWSEKKGLFAYSSNKELYKQSFEIEDQVIPSSNSTMAHNLYELYRISNDVNFLKIVKIMLSKVAIKANEWLPNFTNWMLLQQKLEVNLLQYILVGFKLEEILTLHTEKRNLDFIYVLEKPSDIFIFQEKYTEKVKNIFICNENTCLSKIDTIKEALNVKI